MQCTGNETQGKMRSESALCMTSLIWDLAVLASSGPHSKFVSPVAVPSLTVDGVIQGLVAPWIVLRAIGREKYNGR